ncbi:MAG TPA: hypothetical protein VGG62_16225 [Terracidiphilus sp.]
MPEHYPKATVEVKVWCNVCHRETMHRVNNGRRGSCLECIGKREREIKERRAKPPLPVQQKLF